MNFIAVDDEILALKNITALLNKVMPEAAINSFLKPDEALQYLSGHEVDVAFLDIEMGNMNGIILAKKCKERCNNINIIFVTGYEQYTMEAFRIHASGYLLKPVREKDLRAELENLRHPLPIPAKSHVRIQTFGNFEIFVDKKPLHFTMAKCKECLAYLVDRKGACVTTGEIAAILWEDRPYDKTVQNNTHRVVSDLLRTLKNAGARDIIIKTRREIGIDLEKVDCDYYQFLKGDVMHINAFYGEYMSNYSWAELTLSSIKVKGIHDSII